VKSVFKTCPHCSGVWPSRREFLHDDSLHLVGYQVDFERLSLGLLLFNHRACGTTLAVRAGEFRDLYDGPVYERHAHGEAPCPEYCLNRSELGRCPAECECAWVREILAIVRGWPKFSEKPEGARDAG
jgi:hypothetical protein